MPANNALLLSDINFDGIKDNLKNFLSNQTELGDYDYESSTMQVLLNLLAYNTYMNSFYLNMVGNEMFLDSAQIRSNVVSRAKMLGYTPRSAQGPTASISVTITPTDSPDTISIAANTNFTATVDGQQFVFVNPDAAVINVNSQGVYSTNLSIVEGLPQNFRYTVSSLDPQKYVIPNDNVDTRSITVQVQQSASNTSVETFTKATNLTAVTGNSAVFFLDENSDDRYEIFFGDNVVGKAVNDGNIVNIGYRICNAEAAEGANTFSAGSTLGGYSDYNITLIDRARGGTDKESIQSIKFNAPKNYENQNRAVTVRDYENIIRSDFSFVQTVSGWGGEENSPPTYGKVYLSVKPKNGTVLSNVQKATITESLQTKNMVSVEPIIVNPTYLYVKPEITIKYNPNITSVSASLLLDQIVNKVISYETNQLGLFSKNYVNSEFIKELDKVSESFTSVDSEIRISKIFTPDTTNVKTYTIPFNRSLLNITGQVILRINPSAHPGRGLTVNSSTFTYKGFTDTRFDDDAFGNLRTYYVDTSGVRIYTNRLAGTINYNTGLITINNLLITDYTGNGIELTVDPDANDIDLVRNQIILIKDAKINLYDNNLKRVVATTSNVSTQGETTSITEDAILSTVF